MDRDPDHLKRRTVYNGVSKIRPLTSPRPFPVSSLETITSPAGWVPEEFMLGEGGLGDWGDRFIAAGSMNWALATGTDAKALNRTDDE